MSFIYCRVRDGGGNNNPRDEDNSRGDRFLKKLKSRRETCERDTVVMTERLEEINK